MFCVNLSTEKRVPEKRTAFHLEQSLVFVIYNFIGLNLFLVPLQAGARGGPGRPPAGQLPEARAPEDAR